MKRAILTPPALPPEPLAELKQWLAITTTADDASLTALLLTAIEACEGFTGQMPLETPCEEVLPATRGWHALATAPVQAIVALEAVADDNTRAPIDPGDYLFDIGADGCGQVNLLRSFPDGRVAVQFTAGLAPQWEDLPTGLRHGIVRLAAHSYRERNDGGHAVTPPAAVAALWRPWRRMRVA